MPRLLCVMAMLCIAICGLTQEIPPLAITPSSASVLVGDARMFRAVNRDGEPATSSFVRWDVDSPNAHVSGSGSDVEIAFDEEGEYTIHAYSGSGSASAKVHVLNYRAFPIGTKRWTIDSFEGCHTVAAKPMMPTRTPEKFGYMQDVCPRGNVIREFAEDGREYHRFWIGDKGFDPEHPQASEPKALLTKSLCDSVKPDMCRDDVVKLAASARISVPESDKSKDVWTFEEDGGECRITFKDGKVAKKQKVIEN